jgi:hypothetical protein
MNTTETERLTAASVEPCRLQGVGTQVSVIRRLLPHSVVFIAAHAVFIAATIALAAMH